MNNTKIEWTDMSWNPVTGCKHTCKYCYARQIAHRFKGQKAFPRGFEPMFHPERLNQPIKRKKPTKIFCCSMSDLFGDWVPKEWITKTLDTIRQSPQHTFQILTKNPKRLKEFSFPQNIWLGTTTETNNIAKNRIPYLLECNAKIKFISAEPIQGIIQTDTCKGLDWLIVGWVTGPQKQVPNLFWVDSVIKAGMELNIPVFEKPNTNRIGPKNFPRLSLF